MRLKELREAKGLSQRQLANELGMVHQTYSNYERGDREPNIATLIKLADYFEVPRYDALPLSKFDEGMSYIKAWQLPTNLVLQVRDLNSQTELEV